MNEHTISLVRESFDLIEPIAPQAGAMFYANLFEADPSLQRLFKGDMSEQGAKLMQMIAVAVARLDQPEVLMPVLENLGRRHAGYGVQDAHYDTVGAALLKTLYQGLGVAYNAEVEEAWVEVYGALAATMKQAAARVAQPA
ncbi:MAG: hemin receptor [Rhizobiales bacterium]|nr:hemin receptor [Rhizobacter sp.]